ncbi:TolC family protein [Terrimonas pollutisoli]|uniref:TolC family protein n=1 Tax=Terrimonas pollutisoli TaxID=3034147 RepID=UPI0023EB1729|nr:TolC family protein [Terrimonas sp. H1YJ31]
MKKGFIVFLSVLFFYTNSFAQQLLTLEEAIATALQNNYDIQLSKNDSLVAALDYSYRNAAFLPTLNGTLGTTWNNNNQRQTLADGSKREQKNIRSHNTAASVALNWTLFDGLKMFAIKDKAAEYVQLGSLEIKNQVVNSIATVITTYYNIVRQKQQLKAVEEQITLNEERVRLSQYKLDIGTGIKPDLLQSKVDLNAQKALKLEQQTLIEQLKEQLNQAMNVNKGINFEVSDSIPINTTIGLGDIQLDIEKNNPGLLIAQKNVDIARLTLNERKADRLPIVSFNSAYNYSRTDNKKVINPFSPLFNQSNGLNYGFTANIPIFNRFNTKRLIRQAELDIRYQQLVFENQRSLVNLDIITAFKNYELQKKALALEEENILLARENVDIVFQTYKLGAATLVQLREAQNSLEAANNRLIAARYATKLAETELLRLKGNLVK